jgi:uncharacterized protein (TIGR02996 family)
MDDEQAREALFRALETETADRVAQAALADWFDEHGDASAAGCLRWLLKQRRRPGRAPHQPTYGKFFWELEAEEPIINDPPAQLPGPLWEALRDNDEPHPVGSFKSYRTARAAYIALLAAWKRAPAPNW